MPLTTEERNEIIRQKLSEGLSLPDVQKLLDDEYDVTMTYLDLRLLASELDVDWQKQDDNTSTVPSPEELDLSKSEEEPGTSTTKVTVSKVVRPGAAVSGDVEFASGARAEWFVDTMGRLGLNPAPDSPRPTETDVQEFQVELQKQLAKQGY